MKIQKLFDLEKKGYISVTKNHDKVSSIGRLLNWVFHDSRSVDIYEVKILRPFSIKYKKGLCITYKKQTVPIHCKMTLRLLIDSIKEIKLL